MVHYVYWEQQEQKVLETIELSEIAQAVPELAEMMLDEANDEALGELFAAQ